MKKTAKPDGENIVQTCVFLFILAISWIMPISLWSNKAAIKEPKFHSQEYKFTSDQYYCSTYCHANKS